MKNYFTISEFAKLRDININSLHYYEKLGLLKPAVVDKTNGYRYYSAEQVSVLNKIILCIQLGIPLKEMVGFLDEEGNLQSQKLLEKGRVIAQQRIREMQNNLDYIEYSLHNIEENKQFKNFTGVYERQIHARKIITTPYYENMSDPKEFTSEVSKIYHYALKKDMFPILPAGQIMKIDVNGKMRLCFYLEILNEKKDKLIQVIPEGRYKCLQIVLEPDVDLLQAISPYWNKKEEKTIIVNNVMMEKYSFGAGICELQKLEFMD